MLRRNTSTFFIFQFLWLIYFKDTLDLWYGHGGPNGERLHHSRGHHRTLLGRLFSDPRLVALVILENDEH